MDLTSLKYKKPVDEQLVSKLIYFIQSSCRKSSKIITEVNGTINSLVSGVLFKKALGEKSIAMIFDFDTPKTNALVNLCNLLTLETYVLKRGSAYQSELSKYNLHKQEYINSFYKRFVNYHLSVQADIMKASVADTIDKSERLMYQRPDCFYGSFIPFYSLYKTEVYDLAKLLDINQPSNDSAYWEKIDPVLFLLTEKQSNPEEIAREFNIDPEWLKKLKTHIDKDSLKSPVSQFII